MPQYGPIVLGVGSGLFPLLLAIPLCDHGCIMTTTLGAPGTQAPRDVRRAYRDLREPVLGGVAAGLAEHLGLTVLIVRVGFVVGAVLGGAGIAAYAVLWAMLPAGPPTSALSPGLESATRGGRRPGPARRLFDVGPVVVLGALAIGAVFVLQGVLGAGGWIWPLAIAIVGVALLWRQADEAQRERWVDARGRIDPVRIVLGDGGWASYARLAAGVGLIVVAIVLYTLRGGSLSLARDVTFAVLLVLAGLAIVVGPWVYRLAAELSDEREERVRTQERADVAAHLHDSVLQTLALIQKNADDDAARAGPRPGTRPAGLAVRRPSPSTTAPSRARCAAMAGEIEDAHEPHRRGGGRGRLRPRRGDAADRVGRPRGDHQRGQARGVPRIDIYAEITPGAVDVFVRDRGAGFDPDDDPGGPARRTTQHHRPHGPPRRHCRRTVGAGRGHRGAAAPRT